MERSTIVTAEMDMGKVIDAVAKLSGRGVWSDGPFSLHLEDWLDFAKIIGMGIGTIADEWAAAKREDCAKGWAIFTD